MRRVGEFYLTFSSGQAARELWAFGEDDLAERALRIPEPELPQMWATAATYNDAHYPLPVTGRRITLGHVVAFAAMNHLEGALRPLSRQRRRPAKTVPAHIGEAAVPIRRASELVNRWRSGGPSD